MHRCALALAAALTLAAAGCAQPEAPPPLYARQFPATALRGDAQFGLAPELLLDGAPARLAPGARIRAANQQFVLPGTLTGQAATVHYTTDSLGQLHEVWILRPDEAARQPWPRTREQAQAWQFDAAAQQWSKP